MSNSNLLPTKPELITEELVRANYQIEASRLNYQQVLQTVADIHYTRDNINQPDPLIVAREVLKKLTEKKDQDKKPFLEPANKIQAEFNSLYKPLKEIVELKADEKKKLADEIVAEETQVQQEHDRVNGIQSAIIQFINQITEDIVNCNTDQEIVTIEKRIGSEGQKTSVYMEFAHKLRERCQELKPMIVKQKEFIRELKRLEKIQNEELAAGHDANAVHAREEAEHLRHVLHENKIRIQEMAYQQAGETDIMVADIENKSPHARRTMWKWRVDDIEMLNRRMPNLVNKIPNDKAIDTLLKDHKSEGLLDGLTELKLNGLVFYQDKIY